MSIIKADYQFFLANKIVIGAWWKYLKRLLLSYKSCMLFIMSIAMLIRMPEAYAINVTVKSTMMSLSSYHAAVVLPTANIVSLMKGKKPISIPENEVITSEDTEDYLEEDSEEDEYGDAKNTTSGEYALKCSQTSSATRHHSSQIMERLLAVAVSSHVTNDFITCSAIRSQINVNVRKIILLR